MSRRETVEPTSNKEDRGTRETHPAFGSAVVSRRTGTPRTLFQSDLRHNETITLSIHRSERLRDLNQDWVHPREELIEIEMSLAQWGSLVSSIGLGSGVPVTIRRTESEVYVADIPYQPRIAESLTETRGAVRRLLASVRSHYEAVEDAVEGKKGVKALREALRGLKHSLANAEANAGFAVSSLAEAAETVTSQAKADIEAHILTAQMLTESRASIEAPAFDLPEIEQ